MNFDYTEYEAEGRVMVHCRLRLADGRHYSLGAGYQAPPPSPGFDHEKARRQLSTTVLITITDALREIAAKGYVVNYGPVEGPRPEKCK